MSKPPKSTKQPLKNVNIALVYNLDESIEQGDVLTLIKELEKIKSNKDNTLIQVLLNSAGGDIYAAYKMVKCLRANAGSYVS